MCSLLNDIQGQLRTSTKVAFGTPHYGFLPTSIPSTDNAIANFVLNAMRHDRDDESAPRILTLVLAERYGQYSAQEQTR